MKEKSETQYLLERSCSGLQREGGGREGGREREEPLSVCVIISITATRKEREGMRRDILHE